jgi:hypothetical protein
VSPDLFNGLFEFFGSVMIWRNVAALMRDKMLRGVHWGATAFFTSWGIWNLYYYPSLGQWWSFAGGLSIMTANLAWLWLALKYRGR